jgi:hypothetical protein
MERLARSADRHDHHLATRSRGHPVGEELDRLLGGGADQLLELCIVPDLRHPVNGVGLMWVHAVEDEASRVTESGGVRYREDVLDELALRNVIRERSEIVLPVKERLLRGQIEDFADLVGC